MKFLCLIAIAIIPLCAFAQGVITVFSEDGDKFYFVLNGIKQNQVAQTNVRVDGLTNDFYKGKIVFEDPAKEEITKTMNTKDAATGQFAEVTFKIKKTKDGELKLRYFGITPVPVNYNPPPDMYVAHYNQTTPAQTVTKTTVTTTNTVVNPNGVSMNVGANGVNMNMNMGDPNNGNGGVSISMNMADPNTQTNVTQTTTTTTNSYSSTSTTDNGGTAGQSGAACQYPMDNSTFAEAKTTITKATFEATKLSTAKSILSANCATTDQVIAICHLFSIESTKLDFAKFAYSKTTDPGSYFKVANVFSFDASKTNLNNFISNGGR